MTRLGRQDSRALPAVLAVAAAAALAAAGAAGWAIETAYAQETADAACPSAALGDECVYHVTRALDVGDTVPNVIRIDNGTGRVYVSNRPHIGSLDINYSYLRIYDSVENGNALIKKIRFNGTNSRIPDFEINTRTGELHVVHLAGVGDKGQGWGGIDEHRDGTPTNWDGTPRGISEICKALRDNTPANRAFNNNRPPACWDPKGNASLTTISLDTHEIVSTVEINHTEARDGSMWTVERYEVTDLALDTMRDRAYVATRHGPILAVDTERKELLPVLANYTAGSEWDSSKVGARATALAVEEATGTVHAAVRVGDRYTTNLQSWGIASLSFDADDGGGGGATPYYRQLAFLNMSSNPAPDSAYECSGINDYNTYECNSNVWVLSLQVDVPLGKIFALYANHTVMAFALNESGHPGDPSIVHVRTTEEAGRIGDKPIEDIVLDAARGLLYVSLYDWTDPRAVILDADTHARIGVASGTSQMSGMALDPSDGDVYVLPNWAPAAYVIEGEQKHPIQGMIDDASEGDTIEIGPGIYPNAVLDVNKPLTLTSETGQPGAVVFTGYSRIEVEADHVTIRGLSFQDTDCLPGYGASLVEIRTHKAPRDDVTIRDNVFRDTCHAAIQKEGIGKLTNITITDNVFENIGLNLPPGQTEPLDTGGENEFQIAHGAIGLAHHPGQAGTVGGTISYNHINGTSAAGIRVFNADGLVISNNYIANTPASGIGLAHGPKNTRVEGNTIVNANSEPNLDYLAGRNGTGEPDYYKTIYGLGLYLGMGLLDEPYWKPTPDAAISVWSDGENIDVTGNTIRASDGAFAVCTGLCAFESDGPVRGGGDRNIAPSNKDVSAQIRFNANVVYAHNGTDNNGVLVRSNTTSGELNATGNYFVGIDRDSPDAIKYGRVDLGTLPVVKPNASAVPAYDTYHVTETMPVDNSGAWNLEVDAANNRLYVGTDPSDGSDHPDGSSIVYAYALDSGELVGRYDVAGTAGRIADMEANPGTGELHVLHAWLANATLNTTGVDIIAYPGFTQPFDWYRSAGGWGLNVTTLNGSDMSKRYTAGMSHNVGRTNEYDMFPRELALSAGLEAAAGPNLLFVSVLETTPIIVLNNTDARPTPAAMGGSTETGEAVASLVSAMAVNATGPVITAYAVGATRAANSDTNNHAVHLNVVQFNTAIGGDTSVENYDRVGRTLAKDGIAGDMHDRAREVVLDDASDRLFVLWYDNRTVSMYRLDVNTETRGGQTIGIPSGAATLEGTLTVTRGWFGGSGPIDISLDKEAGILYTVVQDVTDPRMLAHNSTTGELLGTTALRGSPVSVDAAGGRAYAASQDVSHVYVVDPQPASDLQRTIDAADPGGVVVVPDALYNNTVLVVNKALTLTSEAGTAGTAGPVLSGKSRIQVEADDVAVRGLAFRDTACLPGLAPPLVGIGLPPGGAAQGSSRSGVTVADSSFTDTCHAAVQQEGYGRLSGVAVGYNEFRNIGLNAGGGAPLDTGGEDEFQAFHGAVGLAYHHYQDPVSNSIIVGNTIAGTGAAGIRVFKADSVLVYGNDISGTPASAVGLSHGSKNSAILHNAIAGANAEPDMDYMSGVSGSGDASYYRLLTGERLVTDGVPYIDWSESDYWHPWPKSLAPHGERPTPDAAVKVWADSANVSISSNTIRSSGGAFVACAGTCSAESGGIVDAEGTRGVLPPASYNASSPANRITFNWNTVHADNDLNGAYLVANNATGMLDATQNYYPGYEPAAGMVRSAATVDYSPPARGVAGVTAEPGSGAFAAPGDTIVFAVRLNAPTTLDTSRGSPALLFGDAPHRSAAYQNGSGTNTLYFAFEVAGDTADLSSALPRSISLNGAVVVAEPNPGAALALPARLAAGDFPAIDMTGPRVVNVTSSPSPAAYSPGEEVPIAVAFSEAVDVAGLPVLPLNVSLPYPANATYSGGSGTATLEFRYSVSEGHSSDRLAHLPALALPAGTTIRDGAGNDADPALPAAGSGSSLYDTSNITVRAESDSGDGDGDDRDGGMPLPQPNRTAATADAVFTGRNEVRINYSAPLGPPDAHNGSVYGNVTAGGAIVGAPVDGGVSGLGTAVHTVRFGGAGVTSNQTGTIALNTGLEGEAGGIRYGFAAGAISVSAGVSASTAAPAGPMPVVVIERDRFVRTVNVTSGGDAVRPGINVSALAPENRTLVDDVSANEVQFPAEIVNLVASFAEVSFPPNVTATAVPADGLLELYIDTRPLVDRVAEAHNVSAARIELQKVVEVGDPDVHIVFDRPVRVQLTGQAGGLAFYVNNTDDTVVPIVGAENECSEDSTDAVHSQLGRTGADECWIESGGDMIIYTYHLTRFGTAALIGDAAPPPAPTLTDNKTATLKATIVVDLPEPDPETPVVPTVVSPAGGPFLGSGGGGGGGGGSGGRLAPAGTGAVTLYGAAWDCNEGTIRITVNDGIRPEVSVLSSGGAAAAQRADGPHPAGRTVYEAPLPGDPILSIRAVLTEGRTVSMATEAVRTGGQCTGEAVFERYGGPAAAAGMDAPEPGGPEPRAPGEPAAADTADGGELPEPGEPAAADTADGDAADRRDGPIAIPPPPPEPPGEPADGAPVSPPPADRQDATPAPDAEAAPPGDEDGGCLIATAAHGTELAPQVQRLREVRDSTLLTTESGRAFMSAFSAAYYAFSPQVADLERGHPALRQAVAALAAPLLYALTVVEAAEPGSEAGVVAYGALAIALVAGVYVAAPAAGAWYAARRLGALRRHGRA